MIFNHGCTHCRIIPSTVLRATATCDRLGSIQPSSVPDTPRPGGGRCPPPFPTKSCIWSPKGSPQSLVFSVEVGVEGGRPHRSGPQSSDFFPLAGPPP